jgi:pimeloyl-ACP methyl ester carboxylesterase
LLAPHDDVRLVEGGLRLKLAIVVSLSLLVVASAIVGVWLWTPDRPRAALQSKYRASDADIASVENVRLHVRDSGAKSNPAVIMLHGFGSSLHTWEPWAQALQDQYRVIRIDLPGSGLSEPDPTGRYDDPRTMDILLALMDRLGVARAALIGNSIGGRIAWSFAARHPERVTKLVLIAPDGFASKGFAYGKEPKVPAMAHVMRYILPRSMVRSSLAQAYGDPALLTEDTVDRYYDLMLAPGSRSALIARMEQTVLRDPVPLLRQIQIPVLLVWGDKDAMIPVRNAADYVREMPQARVVTFADLGHVPHEEAPAQALMPVREFLAQ